jgi:MerR family transcriptional regulator, copper efflux regulator
MRITEAAARLGMSPRMLRYREDLGLLPPLRDRPYGRGHAHRQFTEEDLAAITAALAIERRFDITPAALAFGLRVLTDPAARAAVADLGRRTGHVPAGPGAGRALDFEKERALRALGAAPRGPAGRLPAGETPRERGAQERRGARNRGRLVDCSTTATDGSSGSSWPGR